MDICVGSHSAGAGNGASGFSGLTMPFTHRGGDKADPSTRPPHPPSFSSSPVNGLLYVRGKIGEGVAKVVTYSICKTCTNFLGCKLKSLNTFLTQHTEPDRN